MGTDHNLCCWVFEEPLEDLHLASIATGGTEVVAGVKIPIGKEAVVGEFDHIKRATDGAFRHRHDHLFQPLVVQLVQPQKHQCTGLSRGGRRFQQQVLGIAGLEGPLLHLPHPEGISAGAFAGLGVGDVDKIGHRQATLLPMYSQH